MNLIDIAVQTDLDALLVLADPVDDRLVDNQPGVLSRVVGLFSGKGFNIESLCVAPTMDPQVSRITIVTMANPPVIEQIEKQLRKLINIIKLRDMTGPKAVKREMALICVKAKPK